MEKAGPLTHRQKSGIVKYMGGYCRFSPNLDAGNEGLL